MKKFTFLMVGVVMLAGCNQSANTTTDAPEEVEVVEESILPEEGMIEDSGSAYSMLMSGSVVSVPETNPPIVVEFGPDSGDTVEYNDGVQRGTVTVMPAYVMEIDGGNLAAVMAFNSGGSGEFMYLMAMEYSEANYSSAASVSLGDRIDMKEMSVEGNVVTVRFMQHGADQAMAEESTEEVTKTYDYEDGVWVEM
jgi:hypothetical protein